MASQRQIVQAKSAAQAHELLVQKNGKHNVVAYPVNSQDQCCLLHYVACSSTEVRDTFIHELRACYARDVMTRADLKRYEFETISPNLHGDPVVLVRLRPSEIASKLGKEIVFP